MKNRPLLGKKIMITRAHDQSSAFAKRLKSLGADVIEFPTIEISPPSSWKKVDNAIANLESFDWIIFTSANGVNFFFQRLGKKRKNILPPSIKVCAIGPATADQLLKRGCEVDYIPEEFIAEAILKGFEKREIKGKRILIARAKKARDVLPEGLKRMGAEVEVVETYRTIKPKEAGRLKRVLEEEGIDVITFTSSSTVNHFLEILKGINLKRLLKDILIACIGPITSKTARDSGLTVHIQPDEYTIPALTEAIVQHFNPSFNKSDRKLKEWRKIQSK